MTRVAALALLLPALLAVVGCSDDGDDPGEGQSPARVPAEEPQADGLVLTNGRDETWEFHETRVECVLSSEDDETTVVRMTAPPGLEDVRERRGHSLDPFLWVEAVPGVSGAYELPLHGDGESAQRADDVSVFAVDPWRHNELSADEETATGTITVTEAACEPEPALSFTIRATLGSERGLPGVWVKGSLPDPG